MVIKINQKYIVCNVSNTAPETDVSLWKSGKMLCRFDVRLSDDPEYQVYLPVGRFIGETVEMRPDWLPCLMADEIPRDEQNRGFSRPQIHFSPLCGWNNDPNGLYYLDGIWHLFFQYNPAGGTWGNMHWGHAASHNLIHWDEKDIALYPDAQGTMFSGSALVDNNGVFSGLSSEGTLAVLLFYTAAGPLVNPDIPFTQCMAFTRDNGKTFKKYHANPIIGQVTREARDPKVKWCEELGKYVMALFLEGNQYALFVSEDLIHWDELQKIDLPGDAEFPDIYPLIEGNSGERYWILSGASDRYLVGSFQDGRFDAVQDVQSLSEQGTLWYAAQTFDNVPKSRTVRLAWFRADMPSVASSQMISVPHEMCLWRINGVLKLCAQPVEELGMLVMPPDDPAVPAAYDIRITGSCEPGKPYELEILGKKLVLSSKRENVHLRVILDRNFYEIFFGEGEQCKAGSLGGDAVWLQRFSAIDLRKSGIASLSLENAVIDIKGMKGLEKPYEQ